MIGQSLQYTKSFLKKRNRNENTKPNRRERLCVLNFGNKNVFIAKCMNMYNFISGIDTNVVIHICVRYLYWT